MAGSVTLRSALRNRTVLSNLPYYTRRCITTNPPQKTQPKPPNHVPPNRSWLTRKVEESPMWRALFFKFTDMIGYGSPKQTAGRRSFILYEKICAIKPDEDRAFWQDMCFLPPTFQSWFTITNLHIWLLTVRLRALPAQHAKHYQQALIDHFFIDIEDRIRTVLQPPPEPIKPYTFETSFYSNPNALTPNSTTPDGKRKPLTRAPDRIVNQQMKIFKEQWVGMGLSLDLGLVKGDMELAGAVWRNLLGARGAQGIAYPDASSSASTPHFRRSVNLVGGEVINVAKVDIEKEESKDDGSGVHDFPPQEADKYLTYPEVMVDVITYLRREISRLDKIPDQAIINGDWKKLAFGRVK